MRNRLKEPIYYYRTEQWGKLSEWARRHCPFEIGQQTTQYGVGYHGSLIRITDIGWEWNGSAIEWQVTGLVINQQTGLTGSKVVFLQSQYERVKRGSTVIK